MTTPKETYEYCEQLIDDQLTKENLMYQMPPDELLYEWFRESQTSKTKKFTVQMYDDGGYAANAYDVILRVVEWCNSHKELTVTELTKPAPQERGEKIHKEEESDTYMKFLIKKYNLDPQKVIYTPQTTEQ